MKHLLDEYLTESAIISFCILGFIISWIRYGLARDKLFNSVAVGATCANIPVGLVMLLSALSIVDFSYVAKVMSQSWVLFWSGCVLLGIGIVTIKDNY